MNRAIELHDTRVGRVETIGDAVVVDFSPAYIYKSEGIPGSDVGTYAWQNATLRCVGGSVDDQRQTFASLVGTRPTLPEALWTGTLRVAGREYSNLIPVPPPRDPAELHLKFMTGHELTIRARSIVIELVGEEFDEEDSPAG